MANNSKSEDASPKKGGKGKIIVVALLLLIGVGSGGAVWFFMKGKSEKTAEVEVKKKAPPVFVPLDNFTVNLADREHYLQVGLTFEVTDSHIADTFKQYMPILRSKILLLLASKVAQELGTQDGKEKLMGELVAQAKEAVPESGHGSAIETVHFSSFVIQ